MTTDIAVPEFDPWALKVRGYEDVIDRVTPTLCHLKALVGPALNKSAAETIVVRAADAFKNYGATAGDVAAASRRIAEPDILARIRWPADLLQEFSAGLALALADRKAKERAAFLRKQDREHAAEAAANRATVLALLDGIGTAVGSGRNKRPMSAKGERRGDQDQDESETAG